MRLGRALPAALALALAIAAPPLKAQWIEHRSISVAAARKMITACEQLASRNHWLVAIWVLDESGTPAAFARMEGAPALAVHTAEQKAQTALAIAHPSGDIGAGLDKGQLELLGLGLFPMKGGLPLLADGRVAGAIGVGGAQSAQDEECAQAGVDALAK
ncbi:MAG TPA: heme-binding protein [Steroidobacteraceae bacterium]|nr:heme-binding protein [Steroidobacteraceae bacterium]